MDEDEQVIPELGDADSFDEWDHFEPGDDPWIDADLPPVVDDLRPGETLAQRNARLIRRNALQRQADRPTVVVYINGKPERLGSERPTRALIRGSAVKVTDAHGNETWRDLGTDHEAVRTFVEAHASERGFSLEELQRRPPRGRPSNADIRGRVQKRVLVEIIEAAVDAGAKTSALCEVLKLDRRRIAELRG